MICQIDIFILSSLPNLSELLFIQLGKRQIDYQENYKIVLQLFWNVNRNSRKFCTKYPNHDSV